MYLRNSHVVAMRVVAAGLRLASKRVSCDAVARIGPTILPQCRQVRRTAVERHRRIENNDCTTRGVRCSIASWRYGEALVRPQNSRRAQSRTARMDQRPRLCEERRAAACRGRVPSHCRVAGDVSLAPVTGRSCVCGRKRANGVVANYLHRSADAVAERSGSVQ
jgi:hypothetical protein